MAYHKCIIILYFKNLILKIFKTNFSLLTNHHTNYIMYSKCLNNLNIVISIIVIKNTTITIVLCIYINHNILSVIIYSINFLTIFPLQSCKCLLISILHKL